MKKVRTIVIMFFLASCAIFSMYIFKTHMVEDNTPPEISCDSDEISVSVNAEDAEILQGVTAVDNRDWDITDSVTISSMSHFISKGRRTVTYIVFDKANQAGSIQRTLTYTDYTSPKIHLIKPLRYTPSEADKANLLEYMTAEDCLDGDITNQIRTTLSDSYYSLEPGEYELMIQVSNSAGDVCAVPVNVEIVDSSDREENNKSYPMLSEYIVYTGVNQELDLDSYLSGIIQGTNEYTFEKDEKYLEITKEDITVTSHVDYSKEGVYTVEYTYEGKEAPAAVTKLYVVVEE